VGLARERLLVGVDTLILGLLRGLPDEEKGEKFDDPIASMEQRWLATDEFRSLEPACGGCRRHHASPARIGYGPATGRVADSGRRRKKTTENQDQDGFLQRLGPRMHHGRVRRRVRPARSLGSPSAARC
jgi:hypothetical protein